MRDWNGYGVDEQGNIYNKDGSLKSLKKNQKGYLFSNFYYDGRLHCKTAHRIVAEAFLGPCPEGLEVDHINNIRSDNRLLNLQYLSKSDNNQKAYDSGNRDVSGDKNANCKYTKEQIKELLIAYLEGCSLKDCCKRAEVPLWTGRAVIFGNQWKDLKKQYL